MQGTEHDVPLRMNNRKHTVHVKVKSFLHDVLSITWKVNVGLQRRQAGVTQSPELIDRQLTSTPSEQLSERDPLDVKKREYVSPELQLNPQRTSLNQTDSERPQNPFFFKCFSIDLSSGSVQSSMKQIASAD